MALYKLVFNILTVASIKQLGLLIKRLTKDTAYRYECTESCHSVTTQIYDAGKQDDLRIRYDSIDLLA